jgi:hypothetical protein
MVKKTIYLFSSTKHHYIELLNIALLNNNYYNFIYIHEESQRNKISDLFNLDLFIDIIILNECQYTKNLLRLIKNSLILKKQLNNIPFNNGYLLTHEPYTLSNLFILKYFTSKKIILLVNRKKINLPHKIDFKLSLIYSLNTLFSSKIFFLYKNYKNTFFPVTSKKINADNIVSHINCEIDEKIKFKKVFLLNSSSFKNIKSINFFTDNSISIESNFVLITVVSLYQSINPNYFNLIKSIIHSQKIQVYIKDHPTASLSNEELSNTLGIEPIFILNNQMSYEKFIISNLYNIKGVIGPMSNSLLFANEFGIPTFCLKEFSNQNTHYWEYTKEFFKNTEVQIINSEDKITTSQENRGVTYVKNYWSDILKEIIK